MINEEKKGFYIILIGVSLFGVAVVFSILILTGVLVPNIFPPTGEALDINPLASGLLTFLLLSVLVYIGNKVIGYGVNYRKDDSKIKKK